MTRNVANIRSPMSKLAFDAIAAALFFLPVAANLRLVPITISATHISMVKLSLQSNLAVMGTWAAEDHALSLVDEMRERHLWLRVGVDLPLRRQRRLWLLCGVVVHAWCRRGELWRTRAVKVSWSRLRRREESMPHQWRDGLSHSRKTSWEAIHRRERCEGGS